MVGFGRSQSNNRIKAYIAQSFEKCLQRADNRNTLDEELRKFDLKLYQHGKQLGLQYISGGRKYRLKTLGVLGIWEQAQQRWIEPTIKTPATSISERITSTLLPRAKSITKTPPVPAELDKTVTQNQERVTEVITPTPTPIEDRTVLPNPVTPEDKRLAKLLQMREQQEHFAEKHLQDYDRDDR